MEAAAKLAPGTCIIVALVDGDCFSGDLVSVAPDRQIIIENVKELRTGAKIDGNQIYYKSEVTSIRILSGQTNNINNDKGIERIDTAASTKTIRKAELDWILDVLRYPIYIKQCDSEYHKAIAMLGGQDFVGFAMEGVRFGRELPCSLLVFATTTNIFLFDVVLYGRLFPELKIILEAPVPRKIVFDSRFMHDNLLHRYQCKLNAVVDLTVILPF